VSEDFLLDRPFYFYVVLWGERFRNYFLEYCLPSLLAPGNIPALKTRQRSKMLIATRPEDWEAMKTTPIFKVMERYVDAVYLEIPPCPPGKSGCEHMGMGHVLALQLAHRDRAYGILTVPDCLFSDGSIAQLQKHAQNGVELVMVGAALRLGEEPFLERLIAMGAIRRESRRDEGTPLSITGSQMVRAALTGMHSEAQRLEWDSHYLPRIPPGLWWRVPEEEGIVIHALSWAPMLVDYGAIGGHDTSCLEQWTIDGDYAFKNFGKTARMYVVQDSDEIFYAGFGPLADRPHILAPDPSFRWAAYGRVTKARALKQDFYQSGVFDPLKRDIFFLPLRWHVRPLNRQWRRVERRALRTVLAVLAPDPLPSAVASMGGSQQGANPAARMALLYERARLAALRLEATAAASAYTLTLRVAALVLLWWWFTQFSPKFVCAFWRRRKRLFQGMRNIRSRYRAAT
jgi:hypothetical protein